MAKAIYNGVDNVARKVKTPYIGVDNVSRKVTTGYIGVDNVARQCFSGGTPMSELSVGDSVYMNMDGTATEFFVVHQGLPDDTLYDASCDGTWLLKRNLLPDEIENRSNNYRSSSIHTYLTDTALNMFDAEVQSIIKTVRIPFYGTHSDGQTLQVYTGANGLSTKLFVLSLIELGGTHNYDREIGSVLQYFNGASDSDRSAAFSDGSTGSILNRPTYWTRSAHTSGGQFYVSYSGTFSATSSATSYIRPALILPSNTLVDDNFNVIA